MGAAAPTADPLATERRDLPMTTISERTASKFAARLKSEVRASFMSGGRAGVKVDG